MHIFDNFSGETVTVIKGGQLFAVNDKPGAVLDLWPALDKPEKLKSWNDKPATTRRVAAMRAAGWYVETVPAAPGIYAAIAFRADDRARALIYRRAALAAVHGLDCTNPA